MNSIRYQFIKVIKSVDRHDTRSSYAVQRHILHFLLASVSYYAIYPNPTFPGNERHAMC